MDPPRAPEDAHHHTAPADLDDKRDVLELGAQENADLCAGCVKCCTYITVEVDAPRAAWEYDQWIWALHHQGIELYVERPERWFIHLETRCRQLNDHGRCRIYGRHPVLCREYDPRSCERRLPLADIRAWFKSAEDMENWLKRERPRHWRALERYRRPMPDAAAPPPPPPPAFVALSALAAPPRPDPPARGANGGSAAQGPGGRPGPKRAFHSARRRRASSGVS